MHETANLSTGATLADLAVTHAGATRVFHRHGLDFCCNGRRTLADAAETHGLDPLELVTELEREVERSAGTFDRWDEKPIESLIEHVLDRFHAKHREDVPRLLAMAQKVEEVHGNKDTCPRGLAAHLARMAEELEEHMQKEEQVLFPLIRAGQGPMAGMPVRVMEQEHEDHGRNLARLRQLAHDFVPPAEACTTWRALYLGLAELEREVMEHIHLENNVLFPGALRS